MSSHTTRVTPAHIDAWTAAGWWGDRTLTDVIRSHAAAAPDGEAFISEHHRLSWAGYDRLSSRIAAALLTLGLDRGDRVVVLLPDTPTIHATFVGAEKAGLVVMGIGHRAGEKEIEHLAGRSGARAIITRRTHRDEPATALVARLRSQQPSLAHHLVIDDEPGTDPETGLELDGSALGPAELEGTDREARIDERRLGPSELFLLNSTSGTTGLPKCVMQTQNRWFYFHTLAAEFGALTAEDRCMSVVPAPFGFGLWTSHFTPTLLGAPCVVTEDFSASAMIRLIEAERVSVLCCVSTQFIMMLNDPALEQHDVSSLRVMFTGGEAIPYQRALEFEERTGCRVLNFYGSNETGTLTGTRLDDTEIKRLTTGGRPVEEMQVRLYDAETSELLPELRGQGVPACQGPAIALGYWDDEDANDKLFTEDGWMLMGDIVEFDDDGYLRVVGRTSDFIIRGGKNISAPAVEDEIIAHPDVEMAAAVAAPDPVFGERVAAYVELRPGASLTLPDLVAFMKDRGVSKEWLPEHLVVLDALPRASGGKVAKGALKEDAIKRFAPAP
ncbi:MAG: acyl--CoA ligase [Acidimicrobiales bacterium]|nr:acyl--CoA ligase [Acidimicrobiales bacterium]